MPRNRNFSFDIALEPGLIRDSERDDTYMGYSSSDGRTALTFGDVELVNGRRAVSGGWRQRYGYGDSLVVPALGDSWSLSPLRGGMSVTRSGRLVAFRTGEVLAEGLTVSSRPQFSPHDKDVLIATGGDLQKYVDATGETRAAGAAPPAPVLVTDPVVAEGSVEYVPQDVSARSIFWTEGNNGLKIRNVVHPDFVAGVTTQTTFLTGGRFTLSGFTSIEEQVTGTMGTTTNSYAVNGEVGVTAFTTEFAVGDQIRLVSETRTITSITSDELLLTDTNEAAWPDNTGFVTGFRVLATATELNRSHEILNATLNQNGETWKLKFRGARQSLADGPAAGSPPTGPAFGGSNGTFTTAQTIATAGSYHGRGKLGHTKGWVYGITYATTAGETAISIWDMVVPFTPGSSIKLTLPRAPDWDDRIIGTNIYRAKSTNGVNRSRWTLLAKAPGAGGQEFVDDGRNPILLTTPSGPSTSHPPPGVKYVTTLNDYAVVAGHHRYEIAWTFPGNSDLWPILNVANVALASGQVRGLGSSQDRLYVFCEHAIEIWGLQNVGNSTVFTRRHSIPVGVLAPDSIVRNNGEYFFLSNDLRVYILAANFQVRSLSDKVERLFADLTKPELVYAIAFTRDSTIRFFSKEDDKCITLDFRYPAWSTDEGANRTRLPVEGYCEVDGQQYVAITGEEGVFRWGPEYLTDNGTSIRVRRTMKMVMSQSGRSVRVKRLRLRAPGSIETGEADVRWTLDGSSPERHNLTDGDVENGHSYYDFWGLGVGREIEIEVNESTSGALAVSHAHLMLKELGR